MSVRINGSHLSSAAIKAAIGRLARLGAGGMSTLHAVIPIMKQAFGDGTSLCLAAASVVIAILRPVGHIVLVVNLINLLGLLVATIKTGIGALTLGGNRGGGGDGSIIKSMRKRFGVTAIALTFAAVEAAVYRLPRAKVVVERGNIGSLCSLAILTGVGGLANLATFGVIGDDTAIPIMRERFGLALPT